MGLLIDAIEAADKRKLSTLGMTEDDIDRARLAVAAESDLMLTLNGYDLDFEEYKFILATAGHFFADIAAHGEISLHFTFTSCWADAFLVGLMYAKLHSESDKAYE